MRKKLLHGFDDGAAYGNFDGQASRFGPNEAWVLSTDGTVWKEINSASHDNAVREISKAQFDERFGPVPPLPPEAFSKPRG